MKFDSNGRAAAVHLACAILLVLAAAPLPYGYYLLLRIFVASVAGFHAQRSFRVGSSASGWMWCAIAVLFNPIVPIHLGRELWRIVDILVALVFGRLAWRLLKMGREVQL